MNARLRTRMFVGLCLLRFGTSGFGEEQDLTQLSLEDLMNTKVTSVSKKEQPLSRTASAIFVITANAIRRSGATCIPDLLRMVPGLDVAQIDANSWAVSARGMNGRFSNELLVLVDGRNVYTPTFGGVLWDTLDLPLEDIERIEVIRGPGGTVWGINAVNGVINVITKKASETQGAMLVAGGGNLDQGFGTAQYGGDLGGSTNYRVYTKYFNQDHMPSLSGGNGADGWHLLRGGFRTDSRISTKDTLTTQGDVYTGEENTPALILPSVLSPGLVPMDTTVALSGGFLQLDWQHVFSARSDTLFQVSFDRYKRDDLITEQRSTVAADFQHHIAWGSRQDVVWGAGYSYTYDDSAGNFTLSLNPPDLAMNLFGSFVQDEIALVPSQLYATVGTKLERNYYTGFSLMPSARVSWTPNRRNMFWAAVSHAERTPAESDTAARANLEGFSGPGGIPILVAFVGNPHVKNEGLIAYEAGYRLALSNHLSTDLASYYNNYDQKRTTEPATPFFENTPSPPHLVAPLTAGNLMHGEAHGFEMAVDWKPTDRWTLSPGYAFEQIHMHLAPTSRDVESVSQAQGSGPANGAQLRSHLDLVHGVGWDASAYFVDRLESGHIPSYTRLDTGLAWRWTESLAMSLVGQNLAQDRHLEFLDSSPVRSTLIKRSAYAKLNWQF